MITVHARMKQNNQEASRKRDFIYICQGAPLLAVLYWTLPLSLVMIWVFPSWVLMMAPC